MKIKKSLAKRSLAIAVSSILVAGTALTGEQSAAVADVTNEQLIAYVDTLCTPLLKARELTECSYGANWITARGPNVVKLYENRQTTDPLWIAFFNYVDLLESDYGVRVTYEFSDQFPEVVSGNVLVKAPVAISSIKAKIAKSKVQVSIKAADSSLPVGKVVIKVKGKSAGKSVTKSTTATLKKSHAGTIKVKLPRLAKGKYSVTATYKGNAAFAKATAKAVTLRVNK